MRPEIRWPLFIVGLLALQVMLGSFFFWKATSDPSFAVEEDYYQKAVNWEDKQAQDRQNSELGWSLEHTVGAVSDIGDSRTLQATLLRTDKSPVTGALVSVETFHNVRAGQILRVNLEETAPGQYQVQIPMLRPGLWEIRFSAELGSEKFTHTVKTHLSAN